MSPLYKYSLNSTGNSSHWYGECEVCGKHAAEVYIQIEAQKYIKPDGTERYFHKQSLFGHKECLESKQKQEV